MKNIDIINSFLEKNYRSDGVLGVLFYGSRKYGSYSRESDIDLLIVSKEDNNYKGINVNNNIRIEYFQKNFYFLLSKLDNVEYSTDRSLISAFKNGEIILSKNNYMEFLKEEFSYRKDLSRKNKTNYNCNLYSWVQSLYNEIDKIYIEYLYHNLIENIRKIYHAQNGYSKISSNKIIELYKNKKYAEKYYCVNLPDSEVINKFLFLINNMDISEVPKLLSHIYYGKSINYTNKLYSRNIISYKSTIIMENILRLKRITNRNDYIHYYYITLEKLRVLYCNKNKFDSNISMFKDNMDDTFLHLFNNCIINKSTKDILILFKYVTESLNIDYDNYKILDLKKI